MVYRPCVCLSACVLTLFAFGSPASAQEASALAAELGNVSELIVAGRVTATSARWDAGAIYEYVTVAVSDRLKGPPVPASIVLKQLGGRAGDIGLHIEGQASFALGEDVLLFLDVRPRDGTLHTSRLELGKWRLLPDLSTGRPRAVPNTASANGLAGAASAATGLDLDEVRTLVASTPARGTLFVTTPHETTAASPAFAYFPTDDGIPARWHQADDNVAVPVDHQQSIPGWPGGPTQLASAVSRWNNAGTRLRLQLGDSGPPTCSALAFTGNRRIAVYFNDPCGEVADNGTYGIGGGYYTTGDKRTVNGTEFQSFLQGFVILNNTGAHLASAGCFENALTQKLGHAIGLGLSSAPGAIMNVSAVESCSGAAGLTSDDLNGLRSIYPAVASGPNPPQAPTAFNASVMLSTVTLQWTPSTAGGPAETYVIEAGTAPGLANLVTFVVNAPQTSTVVNGVLTGVYYVRVRARNVMGTSGVSPEAVVTVGTCPLPSAPQTLNATINDTLVNLTWGPPATGAPLQGYILAAGTAPGLDNILVAALPATPTAFAAADVAYGDYHVRLFARNACGQGPPTPSVLVRVQPCTSVPNAPTLAFTRNGNQVVFTWTLPGGGAPPSRYWIGVGSSPGNYDLLVMPTPDLTRAFSAVGPSGTYFVRVAAQNTCGFSELSNEVQVVIP